jgi:aminobenzoyl-glutamate utilization protein B
MKLSPLKLALLSAAMATGVLATQAYAAPLKDADRARS